MLNSIFIKSYCFTLLTKSAAQPNRHQARKGLRKSYISVFVRRKDRGE